MKRIIYIPTLVMIACFSIISCKKDTQKQRVDTKLINTQSGGLGLIADMYQANNAPVAGRFILQSTISYAAQAQGLPCATTPAQFFGGYDNNGNPICIELATSATKWKRFGTVPCNTMHNPSNNLEAWGQTKVIEADATTFGSTFDISIYIPTKVEITSPEYNDDLQIAPNNTVTWTADAGNPKDDLIVISYYPDEYGNYTIAANGYPDRIDKAIAVSVGTGSYTFSSEDFADFPDGGLIHVKVGRYNFDIYSITATSEDYYMSAGSTVDIAFTLDKSEE